MTIWMRDKTCTIILFTTCNYMWLLLC